MKKIKCERCNNGCVHRNDINLDYASSKGYTFNFDENGYQWHDPEKCSCECHKDKV